MCKNSPEAQPCDLLTHPALTDLPLLLKQLNLEPIRGLLQRCYPLRAKGGRPPYDPVVLFRDFLAMHFVGYTSINSWTKVVRATPELATCLGYRGRTPAVCTRYDFCYRLLDGPWDGRPRCSTRLRVPHSKRSLSSTPARNESHETLSEALHKRLNIKKETSLPDDFSTLIQRLLGHVGIEPSLERGLLKDAFDIALDGSLVASQASCYGSRTQEVMAKQYFFEEEPPSVPLPISAEKASPSPETGISKKSKKKRTSNQKEAEKQSPTNPPEKWYSDPTARWGYSASKDEYVFGHRLHVMMGRSGKYDLALGVSLAPANISDIQMGMEDLCRFYQYRREAGIWLNAQGVAADKGYDAEGFHRFVMDIGLEPLIPLRESQRQDVNGIERNADGVPLCPAGLEMRWHGYQKDSGKHVYNCPVKRPGREDGKQVMRVHPKECPHQVLCEPESKMGPCVHIYVGENPRLNPEVPRNSEAFKTRYKARTSAERFFSQVKGQSSRPYRRGFLVALMALARAIKTHVLAWIQQDALP